MYKIRSAFLISKTKMIFITAIILSFSLTQATSLDSRYLRPYYGQVEGDEYKAHALTVCQKAAAFAAKLLIHAEGDIKVTTCSAKQLADSAYLTKITFSADNNKNCSGVVIAVVGATRLSPEQYLILNAGSCSNPTDFALLRSLYQKDAESNKYDVCDYVARKAEELMNKRKETNGFSAAPFFYPALSHFSNCIIDQEVNQFKIDLHFNDQKICRNVVIDSRSENGNVPERHFIVSPGTCTSYSNGFNGFY